MKEFKEQYPETTEREQWEDVWYPKLCAEYCARLRAQKSAREDLLQKVSEKWKTLSREQKLSAKATPWTMARALAFVEPTRRNEPRIRPSASDIEAVEKTDHEGERSDAK